MAVKKEADEKAAEKAEAAAETAAEAEAKRLDETVPGGRYKVDGKMVNAHGEPVK